MPLATIVVDPITIVLESPLHVGSGFGQGFVDSAVVRDAYSRPYIPGSTIKGRVRESCERVALAYGLDVCRPPYPSRMCGCRNGRQCIVCRVFGSPGGRQDVRESMDWDNAYPAPPWAEVAGGGGLTSDRTQVGVSRRRGVARESLLFSHEFAMSGLTFRTSLSGCLNLTPVCGDEEEGYYELLLLLTGLRMVDSLGGKRSTGAGRCRLFLPDTVDVRFGKEEVPLETSHIIQQADWLELYKSEVGFK